MPPRNARGSRAAVGDGEAAISRIDDRHRAATRRALEIPHRRTPSAVAPSRCRKFKIAPPGSDRAESRCRTRASTDIDSAPAPDQTDDHAQAEMRNITAIGNADDREDPSESGAITPSTTTAPPRHPAETRARALRASQRGSQRASAAGDWKYDQEPIGVGLLSPRLLVA